MDINLKKDSPKSMTKKEKQKKYRQDAIAKATKERKELQAQGYKSFNIPLSPQAQEYIKYQREHYRLTSPEIFEKAVKAMHKVESLLPPPSKPDPLDNLEKLIASKKAVDQGDLFNDQGGKVDPATTITMAEMESKLNYLYGKLDSLKGKKVVEGDLFKPVSDNDAYSNKEIKKEIDDSIDKATDLPESYVELIRLKQQGLMNKEIAEALNEKGHKTQQGLPWNDKRVRQTYGTNKAIKNHVARNKRKG